MLLFTSLFFSHAPFEHILFLFQMLRPSKTHASLSVARWTQNFQCVIFSSLVSLLITHVCTVCVVFADSLFLRLSFVVWCRLSLIELFGFSSAFSSSAGTWCFVGGIDENFLLHFRLSLATPAHRIRSPSAKRNSGDYKAATFRVLLTASRWSYKITNSCCSSTPSWPSQSSQSVEMPTAPSNPSLCSLAFIEAQTMDFAEHFCTCARTSPLITNSLLYLFRGIRPRAWPPHVVVDENSPIFLDFHCIFGWFTLSAFNFSSA